MPPIIVNHLDFSFGQGEAQKQVLFDISVTIQRGSLTVLMGPSGSGKTTLLTLMGCLRHLQRGTLQLLGEELQGASQSQLETLRRRLGFIFQAHNLHESLNAWQNVVMALEVHGRADPQKQKAAALHMLDIVGLADRVDYLPANLSGGQKQRVAIARALVANPAIVFADEPTAALDKESGGNIVRILKNLGATRGTTTVMVTHDNRIMERADRILTLEDGRLVHDSKPDGI